MSICVLETLIIIIIVIIIIIIIVIIVIIIIIIIVIIIIIIIIIISKIRENGGKINRLALGLRPCLWIPGLPIWKPFHF